MIRIGDGRKSDSWAEINVVVDVFRSTTTIPLILARGAQYVVPFRDVRKAIEFKRKNPGTVLIGEKYGIKPPYFDYDNSPAEIDEADLSGKIVAFTSTNGTYVLSRIGSGRVIFASYVNFSSAVSMIRKYSDVLILPSNRPIGRAEEDILFSELLKAAAEGKQVNVDAYLKETAEINRSIIAGVSERDLEYCLKLDYTDILPEYVGGRIIRSAESLGEQ
ncbi:2-phosphosulfolactate phosphatase family protein [Thermoplasma sp. Kam2015]|uniref:2-phosphosulfolactate phosphatase family protein n=1 Tax=Thermoplasma sp. Kam2015 TaxID=2094122 RepID=UPI000D966BA2|nr:2-phosphosulfolactate phosphatase family protein [Thermoplasma sp. Kam2015]PYB67612.1 2-phosphosulfolactate phosphatase family protein [Thermoplasma sp. Kam2015]